MVDVHSVPLPPPPVPDAPPNPYSFPAPLLPPSLEFQEWFTRQEDTRKFIKEVSPHPLLLPSPSHSTTSFFVLPSHSSPPSPPPTPPLPPQCVLALREPDAMTTEALACSLCCCSYYNESFSALVLDDLLQQTATHASNELKQSYKVLTDVMVRGRVIVSVSMWFTSKGWQAAGTQSTTRLCLQLD